MRFTLRILSDVGKPSACNDSDYLSQLKQTVASYADEHGFRELAHRYASNLASGRYLWRNRSGAEQVEVHVSRLVDGIGTQNFVFDGLSLSLLNFEYKNDDLDALTAIIAKGFSGDEHVLLEVTAFTRLGMGQEVYPSQEMVLKKAKGDKSKTLYSVSGVAALHSQKVGNALRTIDTWYPQDDSTVGLGAIAIEPYGAVTNMGKAYRQPKQKSDFYNLLDSWILKGKTPKVEQQHYVIAMLMRGGVFSEGKSKD